MEEICGKVSRIFFAKNNYTICLVKLDFFETITVKGYFNVELNTTYKFRGKYDSDEKYDNFFVATYCELYVESNKEQIIKYLSSKIFEGVGKLTASKIYDYFQDDAINILTKNPEKIFEVDIKESSQKVIYDKFQKTDLQKQLYDLLLPLEISEIMINKIKIFLEKENKTINDIKENPYILVTFDNEEEKNITFNTADKIYLNYNEDYNFESRIYTGIKYYFFQIAYKSGNTKIDFEEFRIYIVNKLKLDDKKFIKIYNQLVDEKKIIVNDNFFQIKEFYEIEKKIAQKIKLRNSYLNSYDYLFDNVDDEIKKLENENKIIYSEKQKEAIKNSLLYNISIITGAPGTGKTTIINAILNIYIDKKYSKLTKEQLLSKIALCAPTGRAAQVMKNATNFEAFTIHSLLRWDPYQKKFYYNKFNKLDLDIIIIDEFSMVDIFLFASLLDGLKETCKIIILGDPNQLESVGPGQLLCDFIKTKKIPYIILDFIYRQSSRSSISLLANDVINNKKINIIKDDSISIINTNNIMENLKKIIEIGYKKGYNIFDMQILYPKYNGNVGINKINELLLPNYNTDFLIYRDIKYSVNDKIMQLKNDYTKEIYNGDIAKILKIYNKTGKNNELALQIECRDLILDLTFKDLENIIHAYAISIHKSQGSEFNTIILPINHDIFLTKKLLYTAITRAKKNLIIIGDINILNHGHIKEDIERKTNLIEIIEGEL